MKKDNNPTIEYVQWSCNLIDQPKTSEYAVIRFEPEKTCDCEQCESGKWPCERPQKKGQNTREKEPEK